MVKVMVKVRVKVRFRIQKDGRLYRFLAGWTFSKFDISTSDAPKSKSARSKVLF